MNLIAISIRRPVFAWILMSSLILFGAITLNKLGVSQLPDVDFPVLNISARYDGAAPEVIESELLDPIETNLLSIEGIQQIKSTARQGSGQVTVEFSIDRNIDVALQEVQAALSELRLPLDVDPPVIRKQNPEEQPIMFLGVGSDKPLREVLNWTDTFLLDQFRFIPEIGEVSIAGFSQRNLRVWPNPEKLRRADLTVVDLLDAIQSQSVETAAGQFTDGKKELRVRWLGEASNQEELGNIRILRRGGQVIQDAVFRIRDVAEVEDGLSDIRRMARIDGKQAIAIQIRKQRGANEVKLAKAVEAKVNELQSRIPEGYSFRVNVDFTKSTEAVVSTTSSKLVIAAIATIIICFVFLGSWQAALNILFSIPTSILGTFIIIYFSGFTLNLFTLLALTLAISIVVDDAIMLLENIVRHYRMGKAPAQAAYDGSMEILPAATAATLAVVAVFLPVVFMDGVTGKFFFQFGVTMSAAVLLSLLEAVTITPMRAAALMAANPGTSPLEAKLDKVFDRINLAYGKILKVALKHSVLVVVVSTGLFILSLVLVRALRQEFVPLQDQDIILVTGQAPPGSSLEFTEAKTREVEALIKTEPMILRYFVSIGAGGPSSETNGFFMPVYLKPRQERGETHVEIMDRLRGKFREIKGVRVMMRDISARGLTSGRLFPVSFNLSGPNLEVLRQKADSIIAKLNAEGLTQDLDTDLKSGLPELLIRPDREAMAARGVSIDAVARTLGTAVAGVRSTRFTADGRRYDVRVKLRDSGIQTAEDIRKITVRNNFGNQVPLSELVKFETREIFQGINRLNRQRSIGVFGNVTTGKSQGVVNARAKAIAEEELPTGYAFRLEGAAAGLAESFRSLMIALAMGVLVAYMILATQFNSFIHPVSVLVALPFSITGALLTLWLTETSLNLFSFIGLIVLMGIAKKNSILLVEFTNHVRNSGEKDILKALIEACPIRLRPILMTSVATVAAAIPLVIGNSIGQETRTPMGLTIIGGTIVSTIFTLLVVPCIYLLLARFETKKQIAADLKT